MRTVCDRLPDLYAIRAIPGEPGTFHRHPDRVLADGGGVVVWTENQGVWSLVVGSDGACVVDVEGFPFPSTPLRRALYGMLLSDTLVGVWSGTRVGPLGRLAPGVRGGTVQNAGAGDVAAVAVYPEPAVPGNPFWGTPPRGDADTVLRGDEHSEAGLRGACGDGRFVAARRRCHRRMVPGVTNRCSRSSLGSRRTSVAGIARSAQSSRGRGVVRRSSAASFRSTSGSMSLTADERPSRTRQSASRAKTRFAGGARFGRNLWLWWRNGGDELFVRWSVGPSDDPESSRDALTGVPLAWLSAIPLAVEPWWPDRSLRLWVARRLYDHHHLPRVRGRGASVGARRTGPDPDDT